MPIPIVSQASEDGTSVEFVCGPCSSGACCFYPAEDLGGPDYPSSDLPATVEVDGYGTFTLTGDYTYTNGDYVLTRLTDSGAWEFGDGETLIDIGNCLIGEYLFGLLVIDPFLTTYTVNGTDTVTRGANPCYWTGDGWTLHYDSAAFVFKLNGTTKTAPQSSPTGVYGVNTVT